MKPLVSIITPAYNHDKFITKCVESVLKQTFTNWEMLIIDDASTDKTPYIVENYTKIDKRIKLIRHSTNWGIYRLASTYNQALDRSFGKYVAILEGDDFWPEYKLEEQIKFFDDPEIVLSYGKCISFSQSGEIICTDWFSKNSFFYQFYNNYKNFVYAPLLLRPSYIPAVTVMIDKQALLKIGKFTQLMNIPLVDYPTWLRLSFEGKFFGSSEILGYHYRHSSAQSLLRITEITKKEKEIAFHMADKFLVNYNSNDFRSFRIKMKFQWVKELVHAYWIEGRIHLVNLRKLSAFFCFTKGITEGIPYFCFTPGIIFEKFKCFLGILCLTFNINIEKSINYLRNRRFSEVESAKKG